MAIDQQAAIPPLSGTVTVRGIEKPVVIIRDQWGIPHVRAETTADVFFGQGFTMAQDRLFQMEYDRLRVRGETAGILGSQALPWDTFARRAHLAEAARHGYERLDADSRAVLLAHAAGINAFLASCSARPVELQALGHEPDTWQAWDAIAVFLARHVLFATFHHKLFRARVAAALGAKALGWFRQEGGAGRDMPLLLPPGAYEILRGLPVDDWTREVGAVSELADVMGLGGSNSWVISGARTASGLPLMAGDPHRLIELPNVYVQVHLAGPEFDAIGLAFPGVPGVPHFGQTRDLAWCVTNAQADYQDLFIERFRREGDGLLVETAGGWVAAQVRREHIEVRDAAPCAVDIVVTPHGPVIIGDPSSGIALALRSTGLLEPGGSLRTILPMLRARAAEEGDAALAEWVEPANNFLIADRAGAVAYRTAGRIPRHPAVNAWIPVPGWDGRHEWNGMIPDIEMPRCRNPVDGVIVTANQRIVDATYPHVLGVDYVNGDRARRVADRLAPLQRATREDCAAVHRDMVSLSCLSLRDRVLALDDSRLSERARDMRERVAAWHGSMARDCVEASDIDAIRTQLVRLIADHERFARLRASGFSDEPPVVWPLEFRVALALGTLLQQNPESVFGPGAAWEALLLKALECAAADAAPGTRWGERHRPFFAHPLRGWSSDLDAALAAPTAALGGDLDCVFATGSPIGVFDMVIVGSTARYVFDLADRDAGGWIVPLGASGHPASPHFADQHQRWADGELLPIVSDWPRLEHEATAQLRLSPG
jgi:penicillin amidase